jgi:hypothetical protein
MRAIIAAVAAISAVITVSIPTVVFTATVVIRSVNAVIADCDIAAIAVSSARWITISDLR